MVPNVLRASPGRVALLPRGVQFGELSSRLDRRLDRVGFTRTLGHPDGRSYRRSSPLIRVVNYNCILRDIYIYIDPHIYVLISVVRPGIMLERALVLLGCQYVYPSWPVACALLHSLNGPPSCPNAAVLTD
jgi:hypothetical protein